jgi:hypothetical protein
MGLFSPRISILTSLLYCSISLFMSSFALAQAERSNPSDLSFVPKQAPIKTSCTACQALADQYQHALMLKKLNDDLTTVSRKLKACEKLRCRTTLKNAMGHNGLSHFFATNLFSSTVKAGLLGFNLKHAQKKLISTPFEDNSSSKSPSNLGTGGQLKTFLATKPGLKPFVSVSASTMPNASATLARQLSDESSDESSKLVIENNWLARMIVGIETPPLLTHFTAGAGIGGALINQTLKDSMALPNVYAINNNQTSLRPTGLLSATWLTCPTCMSGLGGSISLQIAADQYPGANLSNKTMGVIPFNFGIDRNWQLSEMLVFNLRF